MVEQSIKRSDFSLFLSHLDMLRYSEYYFLFLSHLDLYSNSDNEIFNKMWKILKSTDELDNIIITNESTMKQISL